MLKKLVLLAAIIYSVALTFVSLIRLTDVPDIGISFGDKIFHFLAYFVLAFLWFGAWSYNFSFKKRKAIIYASVFSVVFGIVIEVLQDTLTAYRALDIYDVIANTSGVLLAVLVIALKNNIGVKKI